MKKYLPAFILSAFAGVQFSVGHDISASILSVAVVLTICYIDFIERLDNE
jgi:hypothetical protein